MYQPNRLNRSFLPGLAIAIALAFLFAVNPVFADSETPDEPVVSAESTSENGDAAGPVLLEESPPPESPVMVDDPATQPVDEPVVPQDDTVNEEVAQEEIPPEEIENQEQSPTEEEMSSDLLPTEPQEDDLSAANLDPYFYVGGVLYNFTTTDCDPVTPGNQACANPIQAAFDYLSFNSLKPDGGIVYFDAGTYNNMSFTVDGSSWAANKPTLLSLIGAGSDPSTGTVIIGTGTMFNLVNISLTGFNFFGGLIFTNNTGTITLNDVTVKNTSGSGIGVYIQDHSGSVVFNGVNSNLNNSHGAYVDNRAGTGTVTISNSYFNYNSGYGLYTASKGSITLTNVHASNNSYRGIELSNVDGKGFIKVTTVNVNNNNGSGLMANSNGAITLNNVMAVSNAHSGADLTVSTGTAAVLVKNSQFLHNTNYGLTVTSNGKITLDGVTASETSLNYGALLVNSTSPSGKFPVTILRSMFFQNGTTGLYVDSRSLIKLDNVTSNANGSYGAILRNDSGTGGVTVTSAYGENQFNDNSSNGLYIESKGSVSLSKVFASGNAFEGVYIYNKMGPGNVTVKQSRFEYNNYGGIRIDSQGNILLDQVIANSNGSGSGVYINNDENFSVRRTVKVFRSEFNKNGSGGLTIMAKGGVDLNGVTASLNTGYGTLVDNCRLDGGVCRGLGAVRLLSTMGENAFNKNSFSGMHIISGGLVSLSKVIANNNFQYGGQVTNWYGPGNVVINNSIFEDNGYGLLISSAGNVLAQNNQVNKNNGHGLILDTSNDTTGLKTITVNGGLYSANNGSGISINGKGNIFLTNVTTVYNIGGNGYGAYINNTNGDGGVFISGSLNRFSFNAQEGLYLVSNGNVVLSNVMANDNALMGAWITNYNGSSATIRNSIFNANGVGGINLNSAGNILVDMVKASNNLGPSWSGASFNNTDPSGATTITIQRSTFNFNLYYGLAVGSKGNILLNTVSASDNYGVGSIGVSINNSSGTGNVTISNSFGESVFNGNTSNSILIYSSGNILLRGVRAAGNGGQAYLYTTSGNGNVTILDGVFNNNASNGVNIQSNGTVLIDRVVASGNTGQGINVVNTYADASAMRPVVISRSTFNLNMQHGLLINSNGQITLDSLRAFGNSSSGVSAQNNNLDVTAGIQVLSTYGANWFSGNEQRGLFLASYGPLSLSKVVAVGNGVSGNYSGIYLSTVNQNITFTCGLLSGNGKNGLEVWLGTGTLTLNGVLATGNDLTGGAADPDIFNSIGSTLVVNPAPCGLY